MLFGTQPASAQSWTAPSTIETGTTLQVRMTEPVDTQAVDGRVFTGTVESDVRDNQGRLAIVAGSTAELVVRKASDSELVLDLDSITVNGRRYGVDATRAALGASNNSGLGANRETARNVGGGAVLGAILGAVIGGGDGAAAGAVAGAAAGATVQILTKGNRISVPAEAMLNYRLQSDLNLDVRDTGYTRDGQHFHRFEN
jgi:hypothetical protein